MGYNHEGGEGKHAIHVRTNPAHRKAKMRPNFMTAEKMKSVHHYFSLSTGGTTVWKGI
jgi:hypothetical protein